MPFRVEIRAHEDRTQNPASQRRVQWYEEDQSTDAGTESEPLNDADGPWTDRADSSSISLSRDAQHCRMNRRAAPLRVQSRRVWSDDGACGTILPEEETFNRGEVTIS